MFMAGLTRLTRLTHSSRLNPICCQCFQFQSQSVLTSSIVFSVDVPMCPGSRSRFPQHRAPHARWAPGWGTSPATDRPPNPPDASGGWCSISFGPYHKAKMVILWWLNQTNKLKNWVFTHKNVELWDLSNKNAFHHPRQIRNPKNGGFIQ